MMPFINDNNGQNNDNIPQRPFRRLSGGSSVLQYQNHNNTGLFSVSENHHDVNDDDEEYYEEEDCDENNNDIDNTATTINNNALQNLNLSLVKDLPPVKPCHCASTILRSEADNNNNNNDNDNSTVPTFLEDDTFTYYYGQQQNDYQSSSSTSSLSAEHHHLRFVSPAQQAMFEQIKAKEQPNTKVLTVPIISNDDNDNDNDTKKQDGRRSTSTKTILQQRKEMVEKYWSTLRQRDIERWRNDVVTDDYQMNIVGPGGKVTRIITVDEVVQAAYAVFDSLPDFQFYYRDIEESKDVPGCLVLHDFVGSGTHTGKPFALGPLPAIPPSGKKIVLDEAETHYHFEPETNKIYKIEEIALGGETTGIPGIYKLCAMNYASMKTQKILQFFKQS